MKNENKPAWQENLYQIEQLVGDLYNYSLLCAMESSKVSANNKQVAIIANEVKSITTVFRSLLNSFKHNPNAKLIVKPTVNGEMISDNELAQIEKNEPNKAKKIIEENNLKDGAELKSEYMTIMFFLTGALESFVLKGILEAYKCDASALMICLEEIRKSALDLREIFKDKKDKKRDSWKPSHKIETKKMRINSKKSEYLSFNIGNNEIIEEFSSTNEIFNYKEYHDAIVKATKENDRHPLRCSGDSLIKIDAYLDLHKKFNIDKPDDLNDMKILIIKVPINYKLGMYKNIAVAVDFVNYPLLTGSGDLQFSANQQIKPEYIRCCWFSSKGEKLSADGKSVHDNDASELLFLDWQKLLADHEASTKQPEFEDLLNLSDLEIQSILKKCELADLLFALKGCSPSLKHKIEDNLSEKVKLQLKEEFAKTEAVPLAEVEKAQDKIVNFAFSKE